MVWKPIVLSICASYWRLRVSSVFSPHSFSQQGHGWTTRQKHCFKFLSQRCSVFMKYLIVFTNMRAMCTCTILTVKREDMTSFVHSRVLFDIKCETKTYNYRSSNHLLLWTMISTTMHQTREIQTRLTSHMLDHYTSSGDLTKFDGI